MLVVLFDLYIRAEPHFCNHIQFIYNKWSKLNCNTERIFFEFFDNVTSKEFPDFIILQALFQFFCYLFHGNSFGFNECNSDEIQMDGFISDY